MRSGAQLFPAAQISVWCGEQTLIFMTHLHETNVAGLNLRCHVFARRPRSPLNDGRVNAACQTICRSRALLVADPLNAARSPSQLHRELICRGSPLDLQCSE